MSTVNYHTHSCFCDGKGHPREYVEYAIQHGFTSLGFSGHSPLPYDNSFSIRDYQGYCNTIRALKAEYADRIDIRLGLEIDYVPGILEDFTPLIQQGGLDYTIGSVHLIPNPDDVDNLRRLVNSAQSSHLRPADGTSSCGARREAICVVPPSLVPSSNQIPYHLWMIDGPRYETYDNGLQHIFGGDIRAGVRTYFHNQNAMLERNRPTIVGHPDKIVMHNRDRYFTEDEPWYRDLALETIHLIHHLGLICEINTRGIYKGRHSDFYPGKWLIQEMNRLHIPVVISSDAHQPSDLDRFEGAFDYLSSIGYHEIIDTPF